MYAYFHDRATAATYARYLESLSSRAVEWRKAEALATTHALALGAVLTVYPRQRGDRGYAVAIAPNRPVVVAVPARPWWRTLAWYAALMAIGLVAWWALGWIVTAVEVIRW